MELHVVISVELYKHAPGIFSVIGSNMMRFRPFSTVHTNTTERFQIDAFSMKTLSVCVGGRPKRIEMYAFSNENVLVWTGRNSLQQQISPRYNRIVKYEDIDIGGRI